MNILTKKLILNNKIISSFYIYPEVSFLHYNNGVIRTTNKLLSQIILLGNKKLTITEILDIVYHKRCNWFKVSKRLEDFLL